MNKARLTKFKKLFETQRQNLLFANRVIGEEFNSGTEDPSDEADHASGDMERAMRLRFRNREVLYVKKIDEALKRIEAGEFGVCHECGMDIEARRLEARPTATLCVSCKEDEEKREILTASGREHKSLGKSVGSFGRGGLYLTPN